MRTSWMIAACALLPFLMAFNRPTNLMKNTLDGKWTITITPDDDARHAGEKDIKDDKITFKGGQFTSEAFEKRGFPAVAYEEDMSRLGAGGFTVLQTNKSEDEGTAKWSGFVSASELTGDLVIKKKDGTVLNFSFKGSKGQ